MMLFQAVSHIQETESKGFKILEFTVSVSEKILDFLSF